MGQFKKIIFVNLLALMLTACGDKQAASEAPLEAAPSALAAAEKNRELSAAVDFPYALPKADASEPAAPESKEIIEVGYEFQTENVGQTVKALENLTKAYKGKIKSSELRTDSSKVLEFPQANGEILQMRRYTHRARMKLFIPRQSAKKFADELQKHVVFLNLRRLTERDLETDYWRLALENDSQRYLQNALQVQNDRKEEQPAVSQEAAQADLQKAASEAAIPPQAPAQKPVYDKETYNEQKHIDRVELQKRYWQERVEYATVVLEFYQNEAIDQKKVQNINAVAEKNRPGFDAMLAPMLKQGWSGFLGVILFFIGIWPLALGLPLLWLGWKRWRQSDTEAEGEDTEKADDVPPYPFDDDDDFYDDDDDDERF